MLEWGDPLPKPSKAALRNLYKLAYIAGASAAGFAFGGPAGAAAAAAEATIVVASPIGKMTADAAADATRGDLSHDSRGSHNSHVPGAMPMLPFTELVQKRTRKKTKRDRAMSRGLREAQAKARKKNGDLKKGWNQSRIMKEAHRLARKYGPSTKAGQVRKTARRAYRR